MDHPLLASSQAALRARVIQLLKDGYNANRSSRIVFVCGGNKNGDMRSKFHEFCLHQRFEYDIFKPENAMDNRFSTGNRKPLNISDFEKLIGDLSHAIVIFPEAAGSFAETGYFSAIKSLANRCILVLDSRHQTASFISLGPAKKIAAQSKFDAPIQLNYNDPNFALILDRIRKISDHRYKKQVVIQEFKSLLAYELICLVHEIVDLLRVATIDDVLFVFSSLFSSRFSRPRVRDLASILVGAEYLYIDPEYGHMHVNKHKPRLLELREGRITERMQIGLTVAELFQNSDPCFKGILGKITDAP